MEAMTYRYQSKYAQQLLAQGEAKTLLRVLEHRGLTVPAEARDRILSCSDTSVLDRWVDRALTISTIDELFALAR